MRLTEIYNAIIRHSEKEQNIAGGAVTIAPPFINLYFSKHGKYQ